MRGITPTLDISLGRFVDSDRTTDHRLWMRGITPTLDISLGSFVDSDRTTHIDEEPTHSPRSLGPTETHMPRPRSRPQRVEPIFATTFSAFV